MSRIRFHIAGHASTEWEEEDLRSGVRPTAVVRMTELRRLYPKAPISVEREGHNRKPNPLIQYRFRIAYEDGSVYYSRLVQEYEKAKVLAEIREMYPKGEITEERV